MSVMKKIFIDGKSGTTGLKIYRRLAQRDDVEIISLSEQQRKSDVARAEALNACDVAFLCLPDDAARQAVSFVKNDSTVIIDASTAHRTAEGWLYGFPEVDKSFAQKAASAKRICVPGCHASGFIALIKPLVDGGVLKKDAPLVCTSVTGYSGGGKQMIAEYEDNGRSALLDYPRQYGLLQNHKHLKEMAYVGGIDRAPSFLPIVADFYSGMEVIVPLFKDFLVDGASKADIEQIYRRLYTGNIVYFSDQNENGFISAGKHSGKDVMEISVFGNDDRIELCARYDNLGKGASGAAVECLNYVLGENPTKGLVL